jgi:hypothetical protein
VGYELRVPETKGVGCSVKLKRALGTDCKGHVNPGDGSQSIQFKQHVTKTFIGRGEVVRTGAME